MISIFIVIPVLVLLLALTLWFSDSQKNDSLQALENLAKSATATQNPVDWEKTESAITHIRDRLGRAGFITSKQRRGAKVILVLISVSILLLAFFIGLKKGTTLAIFVSLIIGAYLGIVGGLYFLRHKTNKFHQEVAFNIPLLLENIILLVESGYGVLPALQQASAPTTKTNGTKRLFQLVYQLSAFGLPFNKALEIVADATEIRIFRHVLMHLDISNAEGGELIPSLRGLSDHAHQEWKMGVETRVKRLENFVVFPVFAAVMGLMLLIGAVPLVPLLDLRETMHSNKQTIAQMASSTDSDHLSSKR